MTPLVQDEAPDTLVIAYNFPPFADASAVTVAKRIRERGERVDVIAQDLSAVREQDDSLRTIAGGLVVKHMLVPGSPHFSAWSSTRDFVRHGALLARGRTRGRGYYRLHSRSMWAHSHYLAAHLRTEQPDVWWSAEFSDPLMWHADGSRRVGATVPSDKLARSLIGKMGAGYQRHIGSEPDLFATAQLLAFAHADELVFTNAQQRDLMIADVKDEALVDDLRRRSVVRPHPTLARQFYSGEWTAGTLDPQRVNIGYFGTFYPNRGLGSLLEALRLLTAAERAALRLHVFSGNTSALTAVAEELDGCFELHRALPYLDFLQATEAFNYLLVQDTETGDFPVDNPFLPSKLSDYLGSSTDVLALVSPGSEMSRMNLALTGRIGDVSSTLACLRTAVERSRDDSHR